MANESAITVKELRSLLYSLENQEMTVKELRAMLFSVDNQSQKLDSFSVLKKNENADRSYKMETKIQIKIEHDREGFYGVDENHDQPVMETKYEQAVDAEILKLYPQAKISHEWGRFFNADITVYVDGEPAAINQTAEDIADVVRSIETVIYDDGAFLTND